MDNVTHSLIGVALGEGIVRARGAPLPERWRAGILWAAVLGSNMPDFDLLMRPFVGGGLGYLLHHRGYTHTLALSLPLAGVAALAGWVASRRGKPALPWGWLLFTAWAGVLGHVCADFWNDYGVHPFWPLTNRWFYGDFIFIVEPLLWLSVLPFAYRVSRSRLGKAATLFLGAAITVVAWVSRLAPWPVALAITLWGVGSAWLQRGGPSLRITLAQLLLVLCVFAGASAVVRKQLVAALPEGERLLQLVTTPAPSNPLCWRAILTSRATAPAAGEPDYRARLAVVGWGPERCFARLGAERTAPLQPVTAPSLVGGGGQGGVLSTHWVGEFRGSSEDLQRLARDRCRVDALLRFVRAPFWMSTEGGRLLVGDLRYDNEKGRGFTEIVSVPGETCPSWVPHWDFPGGV